MSKTVTAAESRIEVEGLVKTFATRRASFTKTKVTVLDDVSFSLERGKTLGLVGESGSGKSTLGRCLLHLIRPDHGTVKINGVETQDMTESQFRPFRREIQMVFQNPFASFNPRMTIGQSLINSMCMFTELSPKEKTQKALEALDQVELDRRFMNMFPQEVSGGQLQRAGLARALVVTPKFIFLDEPTAALDMSIRGQIVNLLLDLKAKFGMGFVFVSHDLRVVRYLADRVLVMYLGEIVEEGSTDEIFDGPLHPYTRALLDAAHAGGRRDAGNKLRGELSSSRDVGMGCKLAPRCAHVARRCLTEFQKLSVSGSGRKVRCWRTVERG